MEFAPFDYMHWAKTHVVGSGWRFTRSGILPPPPEILELDTSLLDLEETDPYGPMSVKEGSPAVVMTWGIRCSLK